MLSSLMLASILALTLLAAPSPAGQPPPGGRCDQMRARVRKRRRFLLLRQKEHILYPSDPNFSPYCESHPKDEDCQLPTRFPASEDVSRDVSELTSRDGGAPEMDPVIVPLLRQMRALGCVP
ncbi:MAG: hypothetical protein ACYCWW_07795 [Deltaproteobacteria bacterium]